MHKPLDDLASLLGFDIPLTPVIDLAGIKADGAIIHWTLPEKQKHKSTFKYEIHLNGTIIDTVSIQESAVTIGGLHPSSYYVLRIALVNNLEFTSKSAPIRFRTKSAGSGDFFHVPTDGHETDHDGTQEPLPRVKPYRGLKDVAPAFPDATTPPATREHSTSLGPRRSITGRRVSYATSGLENKHDLASEDAEAPEGAETVQQLTERLDTIRRETDEAERQSREEEEEELRQKDDLIKERDELRAEVAEKEKASRNLKREVNILERQNTAAQNDRTKQDRILQQKIQERQKLKENLGRWEKEAEQMRKDAEGTKRQQAEYLVEVEHERSALRQKQSEEAAVVKSLDEEIREKAAEIKRLERVTQDTSVNGVEPQMGLVEQLQQDAEEDHQWNLRRYELQQQYANAAQKLEQAKMIHAANMRYLDAMRAERRRHEEVAAAAVTARDFTSPAATQDRQPGRRDSQRSRRGAAGSAANESPQMANFPAMSQPAFSSGIASSGFSSAPFLNIHNGMTISGPTDGVVSDDDKDRLTGGAHMSPGAGEGLLPADLFASDSDKTASENVMPLPGLGSLPGLPGPLPGLGQQPAALEYIGPGPASPTSASSRTPSTFASPQVSQQNLHLGSPETFMDSDRRSVRSTRSNRATSGGGAGSRFSGMFGIRQRTKNASLDDKAAGPQFGKAQSHSMPRQDQGLSGLDSAARKRNSSISDAVFGGVLNRANEDDVGSSLSLDETADSAAPPRKRPFTLNPFSKDKSTDGWPSSFTSHFGKRPISPRPVSTHSSELPRPSFDNSRWGVETWPSGDAGSGARASPLSFGGWNVPVKQTRNFASRHPSRRPSVQHGVSGPPDDILEDDDSDALDPDQESHLPPIGTKPSPGSKKAARQADTRLNPNAKDFKSFLSSMRLRDKDKDKDKSKDAGEGSASRVSTPVASGTTPILGKDSAEDDSPPNSRQSRDARSMTTIESSVAESGRDSNDLVLSPSYSNSDFAPSPQIGTGGNYGKESFMQKITRKSSTGMFSLPTFKREKSRLDRDISMGSPTPAPPVEDEEDSLSASVGSLKEQRESSEKVRGSGRSWSSVLKLGKKKGGGETPSVSGLSMASDANGEEDGEE